jgi:alpha-beta hydrolase superfamily lysophospholipase
MLQDAVYHMRVSDALATTCELYTPFVNASSAPFNTTHYITIGHSLGGAAAAGVLAVEDSTLDGVSLDGLFMDLSDVNKPFLLLAGAETIPALDPTWSPFSVGLV